MSKKILLHSPLPGTLLPLEEVPDQSFSKKMLGDGFAIEPTAGTICAPVDGRVSMVLSAGHAVTVLSEEGAEIMVHFGIDTVNLSGEGFKALVEVGDLVKVGDPLLHANLAVLRDRKAVLVTPVIVTNSEAFSLEWVAEAGALAVSQGVMTLEKKGEAAERG